MIDAATLRQSVRYASVGVGSNLIVYACYLAITAFGLGHIFAMTVSYIIGISISFFANSSWSFDYGGPLRAAAMRYLLAYLFGYLINLLILVIGVDVLGFNHAIIQAIAIFVVALALFLLHKYWVFAPIVHGDIA